MEHESYIDKASFVKHDYERFVIVADVDGEHTCVAVMGIRPSIPSTQSLSQSYSIIFKRKFFTKDIVKVHNIINDALACAYNDYGIEIGRAVIAAAGPVSRKRGYIKLTNIDLEVNAQEILDHSLLRKVILLNDFEAIGYGLETIDKSKDVMPIEHVGEDMTAPDDISNTYAVIGAGSGLGMSIAYNDKAKHIHVPLPSEGGHTNFAPQSMLEFELLQYLKENVMTRKSAHPELERVLSGKGIINIYNFLRSKRLYEETQVTRRIDSLSGDDKLSEIESNANDMTCKKTMELFVLFYARAARNLALMSQCYSGLFIIAGRMIIYPEYFTDGAFMQEFELHDERTDVLRKIPVYLVKNQDIGLYGCCNVAINFYNMM